MKIVLYVLSFVCLAVGLLSTLTIKSDIQIIIVLVLLSSAVVMFALARIIVRLEWIDDDLPSRPE